MASGAHEVVRLLLREPPLVRLLMRKILTMNPRTMKVPKLRH
jgi:hypothetical protein